MAPSSDLSGLLDTAAVVPAAGRAARFGGGKLVASVGGIPLIDLTLRSITDAGIARVAVVVDAARPLPPTPGLQDHRVVLVPNVDPDRGMWSSIQAGLAVVDAACVLVLPGDMPFVRAETVAVVARRAHDAANAIVPVCAGKRGHPIALPGAIRRRLIEVDPRSTLKEALRALGVGVEELPVDDGGVLRDVDVAADLD